MSPFRCFTLFIIALAALTVANFARADASCDPVYDAGIKNAQTPYRVSISMKSSNGEVTTSEIIFAGGAMYSKIDGDWHRTMTAQEILKDAQDKRKAKADTCRNLGDQTVAGESATLYSLHSPTGADSKIWISKSRGLVLRQTIVVDDTSIDSTYDYSNVQPPAGAH